MTDLLNALFGAITHWHNGFIGLLAAIASVLFLGGCLVLILSVAGYLTRLADRRYGTQYQSPVRIVSKRIEEGYWKTVWYGDAYFEDRWVPRRFVVVVSLDEKKVECSVAEGHYNMLDVDTWTQFTFLHGRLTDSVYPISIACPSRKPTKPHKLVSQRRRLA